MKTLDTPPPTDFDSSVHGLDTDFDSLSISDLDAISEVGLSDEYELPSLPLSMPSEQSDVLKELDRTITYDQNFKPPSSLLGSDDNDGDGDESELGLDLSESIDSLSLDALERGRRLALKYEQVELFSSSHSPFSSNRSQLGLKTSQRTTVIGQSKNSRRPFYDYLFA